MKRKSELKSRKDKVLSFPYHWTNYSQLKKIPPSIPDFRNKQLSDQPIMFPYFFPHNTKSAKDFGLTFGLLFNPAFKSTIACTTVAIINNSDYDNISKCFLTIFQLTAFCRFAGIVTLVSWRRAMLCLISKWSNIIEKLIDTSF